MYNEVEPTVEVVDVQECNGNVDEIIEKSVTKRGQSGFAQNNPENGILSYKV